MHTFLMQWHKFESSRVRLSIYVETIRIEIHVIQQHLSDVLIN